MSDSQPKVNETEAVKGAEAARLADNVREFARALEKDGSAAMAGLFDLTSHRLVRFAVTITRHQQDAEDAVQTTLVKVADNPKFLLGADHCWSYLLRMVRNEALQIIRRRKRNFSLAGISDLVTQRFVDQAERHEEHLAVWAALRKLPPEQSEVVVLKVWEELTFSQLAEVLEISPSTAASRYRYALEKLAMRLRKNHSGDRHPATAQAIVEDRHG